MAGRREVSSAALLGGYLKYLALHVGVGPESVRAHGNTIREFTQFVGERNMLIPTVSVRDIDAFVQHLAQRGYSKKTLSGKISTVRGFLRYLFGEGLLSSDLAAYVASPRLYRDATVPAHFTWAEVELLLDSIQGDSQTALRDRAMLALLSVYGLRAGEAAALTLDDLDFKHGVLSVAGRKGGSTLLLPLMPAVAAVLQQYLEQGRPNSVEQRQFLLTFAGRPLAGGTAVRNRLKLLVARAGLKSRGSHAIRRAVGTRLVENGWGLGAVAQVLGQDNLACTRVYLRLSVESLRDVADNYGDLL